MSDFANQSLKFQSDAVPENTLLVTRLVGEERISGLFRFELELVSTRPDINLEAVLYEPARIGLEHRIGENQKSFHWYDGVLQEFQELEQGQGWTRYRAILVPDLWKLTEFYRSRIYMEHTVDSLVAEVLKGDLGLQDGTQFEFKLSRVTSGDDPKERAVYPWREYVVQFEETDFDFVARWLEHEGIFFFFENDGTSEKVVFADATSVYKPVVIGHDAFPYRPQGRSQSTGSTQDGGQAQEVLSLHCTLTRQPKSIALNDYNWRDPSVRLATTRDVHSRGSGLQNEYNDHYKTPDQGAALAEVRSQEFSCRAEVFRGLSTCRTFRPGRTFELEEHFRDDFNQPYLLVAVAHEADQSINLEASTVTGANYQNTFEAISADHTFRPERLTTWPAIRGVINAKIESEHENDIYAFLDEQGRYKVRFPFDDHAHGEQAKELGKASRWVRMSQPYAGPDAGMHFPLLPGTEVLITHIDGDPDRPVIAGAVPNTETVSPTDEANRTLNRVRTVGGTTMSMDDDFNTPGFVRFDQTRSCVEDLRFRLGGRPKGGSPGGGAGGAARKKRGSVFDTKTRSTAAPAMGGRPMADLPGPGLGARIDLDTGKADNDPDTKGDLTIAAAYYALVGGEALDDLANRGRYVDMADTMGLNDLLDTLKEGSASQQLSGELFEKAVGIAPLTMGDGEPTSDGTITTALNKLLEKHKNGMTSKDALLAGALQLSGTAYGSRLRMNLGDDHLLQVGDKYTYADVSNDISFGTGGYGFHQEDGDTDDYSEQTGDAKSESKQTGDSFSKSFQQGNSTSDSIQLGASASSSIQLGDSASSDIFVGATQSSSIMIGDVKSIDMFLGGKMSLSMSLSNQKSIDLELGIRDAMSMTLANRKSMSMDLGNVMSMSMRIGSSMDMSMFIGSVVDMSMALSTKSTTSMTLAAEDTLSLTMALKNSNEMVMAAETKQYMTIGAFSNTGMFIGGKSDIEIALGVLSSMKIVAAQIIDMSIAASKLKMDIVGEENEIILQDRKLVLKDETMSLSDKDIALVKSLGV